jgi:ribose transport system substrate-binding protein
MPSRTLRLLWLLAVVVLLVSCKKGGSSDPAALRIAVVPKGTTHEFWKSVHAGAAKAAKEDSVEIVWKGPMKEDDLKGQIDVVQSFTAQKVSGVVLAPLNDKALVSAVRSAKQASIPTVVMDSDLDGQEHVSFVATDNHAAGKLAGEAMGKLLGGKGSVVVLRYQEGSASTRAREQGFLEGLKSAPEVKVVSDNQYGGATTETAFARSESLLAAQKVGPGFGVFAPNFAPNESTTFGLLLALQKAGLAGKVKFVGFDSSEKLLGGLKSGEIDALVVQNPFHMGYTAVKTMVAHLKQTKVEARIDTGARLVTRDNLETPEVKELLSPDLARWLGGGT